MRDFNRLKRAGLLVSDFCHRYANRAQVVPDSIKSIAVGRLQLLDYAGKVSSVVREKLPRLRPLGVFHRFGIQIVKRHPREYVVDRSKFREARRGHKK